MMRFNFWLLCIISTSVNFRCLKSEMISENCFIATFVILKIQNKIFTTFEVKVKVVHTKLHIASFSSSLFSTIKVHTECRFPAVILCCIK
jgi:hypothetical protein